jgi:hypothetical protein
MGSASRCESREDDVGDGDGERDAAGEDNGEVWRWRFRRAMTGNVGSTGLNKEAKTCLLISQCKVAAIGH